LLVDPQTKQAELLDFQHNPGSVHPLVTRLLDGRPVQSQLDVIKGVNNENKGLAGVFVLAKRIRTLVLDDWVFGVVLVLMNIVFVRFAWSMSGIAVNALVHLVYEVTGLSVAEPFAPDLSGSGNYSGKSDKTE